MRHTRRLAALTAAQAQFLSEFRLRVNSDATHGTVEHYFGEHSVLAPPRGEEPLPPWLKLHVPKGAPAMEKYHEIRRQMRTLKLSTVCEEAKCPNIGECWGGGDDHSATATIMIMGSQCTRACRFCSVLTSKTPPPLDPAEPTSVATGVAAMGVDYIVVTMVDRDDLPDGGSAHVAATVRAIKERSPSMLLEVLAGDFAGIFDRVDTVAASGVDVYAHNVECVERITPNVRDRRASYRQSLATLEHAAKRLHPTTGEPLFTKSSIMLGLGEHPEEVRQCLKDLRTAGVSAVTLGQYLQPSRSRMRAVRYAHPKEFDAWKEEAMSMGFIYCASGPMVRSSYRAGEYYIRNYLKKQEKKEQVKDATSASDK